MEFSSAVMLWLALTLTAVTNPTIETTEAPRVDKNLLQHWVLSDKESSESEQVYRPKDFKFSEENRPQMQNVYGGIKFLKNNECQIHRWRRCGNDTGAPYKTASYQYNKKQKTLRFQEQNWTIISLEKEKLVLKMNN